MLVVIAWMYRLFTHSKRNAGQGDSMGPIGMLCNFLLLGGTAAPVFYGMLFAITVYFTVFFKGQVLLYF